MDPVLDNLDLFLAGFLRSLGIAAWGAVGSLTLGTLLAVMRISPIPVLNRAGATYVTLVRNTPLAVLLLLMVIGVPRVGIGWEPYVAGVVSLSVYTAAFVCEAIRSGVNAVSTGQAEAARSIGLGFGQSLRHVVLPQATRSTVPPLGNVIIAMVKNSAVVGAFGVGGDLFSVFARLTSSLGYAPLPVLTGIAVGYLCMTLPLAALLALAERRLAVAR